MARFDFNCAQANDRQAVPETHLPLVRAACSSATKKYRILDQVFFAADQMYREEQSVCSYLDRDCWRKGWIGLPAEAQARNVRIDFSGPQLRLIEIASLRVSDEKRNLLDFPAQNAWNEIHLYGDAERLESPKELRVKTEGIDPQLYLPTLEAASEELRLFVESAGAREMLAAKTLVLLFELQEIH